MKQPEVVPKPVESWLHDHGVGKISSIQTAEGGCISSGRSLLTSSGERFFLKTNTQVPADFFQREAEGLTALRVPGGVRVPETYLYGTDFILLEDLQPTGRHAAYWDQLGVGLAIIHQNIGNNFGFSEDNYIGSTPQSNHELPDGYEFFAQHRLEFQASIAFNHGLLVRRDLENVRNVNLNLRNLIPEQPASILHGDLWSGNVISDLDGNPSLIDPAVYYGWGEADLAMTALFGRFPDVFYHRYQEARPLAPGVEDRFPIYNLYHLLNHLNIFGSGYLSQVREILSRFG